MDSTKRKQTMSVLSQLRPPLRKRNEWTGEELPESEEERQAAFDADKSRRVQQSLVNRMGDSAVAGVYNAVSDVKRGPTGMASESEAGPAGMVPYSPEEFERRSMFSNVRKPEARKRKKKPEAEETGSDAPVDVNAEY